MIRDNLKNEIGQLSLDELKEIAEFVASLKNRSQTIPFWQISTPKERAENFRLWVKQLPQSGGSLPDTAFDRGNIYE